MATLSTVLLAYGNISIYLNLLNQLEIISYKKIAIKDLCV